MPHPKPRDVVARILACLLVQMLVLIVWLGVFLRGAFSTGQGIDEIRYLAAANFCSQHQRNDGADLT